MNVPVKKKLSTLAIVSMIGAILFAIAAACMVLLPFMSQGKQNTFDISVLGKEGKNVMDSWAQISSSLGSLGDVAKSFYINYFIEAIAGTVAFFGIIACGVMIVLGKALNFKHGGRVLALLFAIFGFVISAFFLVWTIIFAASGNKFFGGGNTTVGIGPILMTSFSFVAMIFCFLGLSDRKAFKNGAVGGPVPGYAMPGQDMINPVANVNPYAQPAPAPQPEPLPNPYAQQAPSPYAQPAPSPYAQPEPLPNPYAQPAPSPYAQPAPIPQPAVPQAPVQLNAVKAVEEESPTIAQVGAIEGVCGQFANAVINLKPNEKVLIGRDPSTCNIVISSEKKDISRTHCSVKYDPYTDSFKVIDTSSNGTFVNGQKLVRDQETQLPAGTVLSLGSGENQFRLKKV